jgi:hypothetical protein
MDENGYPTDEELEAIEQYDICKDGVNGLLDMLEATWYYGHPYFVREGEKLELHTGGWSGNESIIEVLQKNYFWFFYWTKSERGGHYYFEIPADRLVVKEA